MDNITAVLNCKTELYQKKDIIDDMGDDDFEYQKVKDVWVQIIPLSSRVENFKDIDDTMSMVNSTHKNGL